METRIKDIRKTQKKKGLMSLPNTILKTDLLTLQTRHTTRDFRLPTPQSLVFSIDTNSNNNG